MKRSDTALYFVRHCETDWNRVARYQGHSDRPLSADGIAQAKEAAAKFARILAEVRAVYTSPLERARMTAALIARDSGREIRVDPLLREIGYGEWEGHTQVEIKARWPDLYRLWKKSPQSVKFPGGEALSDLQSRVRTFLRNSFGSEPFLAVAHTGVMRMVILEAMALPLAEFRKIKLPELVKVSRCDGALFLADCEKGDVAPMSDSRLRPTPPEVSAEPIS